MNLMIDTMKINMTYQRLIDFVVCERDSKDCMIHRCKDCPGTEPLKQHIFQIMNADDADGEELITFKQWTKTDRTELVTRSESLIDFIDLLIKKLDALTSQSYIAKAQAKYLKKCKDELKIDEVIVLGDFAEYYSFVVQDEVQGYHWNSFQCTLHPIMIYHKTNTKLQSNSLYYLSDELTHDVNMFMRY